MARNSGIQATLPVRKAKAPKPIRHGVAYLVRREDGLWLAERRPDKGLLGGMLGWPGADWGDIAVEDPPLETTWSDPQVEVRHTFTHFHLRLALRVATVGMKTHAKRGEFQDITASDLPTVMRKAFDIARHSMADD